MHLQIVSGKCQTPCCKSQRKEKENEASHGRAKPKWYFRRGFWVSCKLKRGRLRILLRQKAYMGCHMAWGGFDVATKTTKSKTPLPFHSCPINPKAEASSTKTCLGIQVSINLTKVFWYSQVSQHCRWSLLLKVWHVTGVTIQWSKSTKLSYKGLLYRLLLVKLLGEEIQGRVWHHNIDMFADHFKRILLAIIATVHSEWDVIRHLNWGCLPKSRLCVYTHLQANRC